jgi:hypothetical protein
MTVVGAAGAGVDEQTGWIETRDQPRDSARSLQRESRIYKIRY